MYSKRILSAAMLSVAACVTHADGMDSQLDNIFDDMANFTPPGVYQSQRRGVIAGGRLTTKARIMDTNFVNIQAPSWKGGCGGIDMFGGSFSFINADQLVQLLRTVAANAKGYAFQVAMKNMSPLIATTIAEFQEKVQKLNQLSANSCQLAQGIVNDSIDAIAGKDKAKKGRTGVSLGTFVDEFSAAFGDGSNQAKTLSTTLNSRPDLKKEMYGNITWISLNKHNAANWFIGGDQKMLEALMSLTGSIVVPEPTDDPDVPNSASANPVAIPSTIDLKDIIVGSEDNAFTVYSCEADTDLCMSPAKVNTNMVGLKKRISDQLLTPGSGIVDKLRSPDPSAALTTAQQNFMANLPQSVGSMIFRLSAKSGGAAVEQFVISSINAIAIQMAYEFALATAHATAQAVRQTNTTWRKEAIDISSSAMENLRHQYSSLINEHGDLRGILETYERYMKAAQSVEVSALKHRGGN